MRFFSMYLGFSRNLKMNLAHKYVDRDGARRWEGDSWWSCWQCFAGVHFIRFWESKLFENLFMFWLSLLQLYPPAPPPCPSICAHLFPWYAFINNVNRFGITLRSRPPNVPNVMGITGQQMAKCLPFFCFSS